jgi:hypothetical protein
MSKSENKKHNIKAYSIKDEINEKLINTKFELWDKYSILFLVSIFEFKEYQELYEENLALLKKYILWARDNQDKVIGKNMYKYYTLVKIYHIINDDIFYDRHFDYKVDLNNTELKYCNNDYEDIGLYVCGGGFIMFGVFFVILFIILSIKNFLLLTYKKSFINNIPVYTPPLNIPILKKKDPIEKIINVNAILSNLCKSSSINELINNFKINTELTENTDKSNETDDKNNLDNFNINKIEELFKNNDLIQNIIKTFSMSVL